MPALPGQVRPKCPRLLAPTGYLTSRPAPGPPAPRQAPHTLIPPRAPSPCPGNCECNVTPAHSFGLEYASEAGTLERPVIVHRAVLGSVERMFAILTEHFAGKWPFWLNPRQVMVVPISENSVEYAFTVGPYGEGGVVAGAGAERGGGVGWGGWLGGGRHDYMTATGVGGPGVACECRSAGVLKRSDDTLLVCVCVCLALCRCARSCAARACTATWTPPTARCRRRCARRPVRGEVAGLGPSSGRWLARGASSCPAAICVPLPLRAW